MRKKVYSLQFIPRQARDTSPRDTEQSRSAVYRIIFLFFLLFTVHCALSTVVFAQPISSTELINNAKQLDGKTVLYQGEVIGDIMRRGDFTWINVNDGKNALGIWLEAGLTKDIHYTGTYKSIGDIVAVSGIFHRACPQHGGDLDIHGQELVIIKAGYPLMENLDFSKRNAALVLCAILGVLWILSRLRRRLK